MLSENAYTLTAILEKDAMQRMTREQEALNGQLRKYGVRLTFGPSRNQGHKAGTRCVLRLSMDPSVRARGAGRRPSACGITMEEALRMEQQGAGKKEIAAQMGTSLSSYYRRRGRYLEDRREGSAGGKP